MARGGVLSGARWRFAAHLGIADPARPLLVATAGSADPIAQIDRAALLGFAAITDNGLVSRAPQVRRAMARALAGHGLGMGSFTQGTDFFWGRPIADIAAALAPTMSAAADVGGGCINLILLDAGTDRADQRAQAADNLARAAEIARGEGLRIAVEAISRARVPGALVEGGAATLAVIAAAPDLGLVLDSCHCHCAGDDMAALIRANGGRLTAVQIADTPGRTEPGSGVIDFAPILAALADIGWAQPIEAEFDSAAPGRAGEAAAVAALARL